MILGEGINGLDTYRQVQQKQPGQWAIITSGSSKTERIAEALRLGAGRYVKKPYMLQKIGLAGKEQLAREPAG
jgi:two-component system, cell cycle sensor histidine kinase and response regulator CckA